MKTAYWKSPVTDFIDINIHFDLCETITMDHIRWQWPAYEFRYTVCIIKIKRRDKSNLLAFSHFEVLSRSNLRMFCKRLATRQRASSIHVPSFEYFAFCVHKKTEFHENTKQTYINFVSCSVWRDGKYFSFVRKYQFDSGPFDWLHLTHDTRPMCIKKKIEWVNKKTMTFV